MDDVLLDAPLAPSHDFLSALGAAGVLEVPGATPRQEGSDDPYQAARDRGLHRWLDLHPPSPEATGGAEPAPEATAEGVVGGVGVGGLGLGLGVGVSAMVHRVHAQQAALAAKIARKRVAEEDYYANRYQHTAQPQAPQPPPGPGPPHPTS